MIQDKMRCIKRIETGYAIGGTFKEIMGDILMYSEHLDSVDVAEWLLEDASNVEITKAVHVVLDHVMEKDHLPTEIKKKVARIKIGLGIRVAKSIGIRALTHEEDMTNLSSILSYLSSEDTMRAVHMN